LLCLKVRAWSSFVIVIDQGSHNLLLSPGSPGTCVEKESKDKGWKACVQAKGWFDGCVAKIWIDTILKPYVEGSIGLFLSQSFEGSLDRGNCLTVQ